MIIQKYTKNVAKFKKYIAKKRLRTASYAEILSVFLNYNTLIYYLFLI